MSILRKFARYYYTLKPLKLSQYYYLLKQRVVNVKLPTQTIHASSRDWDKPFDFFLPMPLALSSKWSFNFLGESGSIDTDWNSDEHSKLWLYNLHYHDDLNKLGCDNVKELHYNMISKWINENPPMQGNGWEPYPLSLRIVNWIKWLSRQEVNDPAIIESLCNQATALNLQLEYHLRANHLFENAKALVFFGSYIESPDAERCLKKGVKLLDEQVSEQFFDDGGHFEGSPMYHASLLWGMCDLYLLAQCSKLNLLKERSPLWKKVIQKGMFYLKEMCHPDGEVSFFNDSTFGIAPSYQELNRYVEYLGFDLQKQAVEVSYPVGSYFEKSGYLVVNLSESSKAILDIADIGPDCQPGHAHADTLSFELSLFGKRVFVNSGISQYGTDIERQRQRSTQLHNTVVVDGENSSDVWGGFRVGRKANVTLLNYVSGAGRVECEASHDGYKSFKRAVIHKRQWKIEKGAIEIKDQITSSGVKSEYRLHLHPDVTIKRLDEQTLQLCINDRQALFQSKGCDIHLEKSTWYPGFGQRVKNNVISIPFEQAELVTNIYWDEK